MEPIYHLYAKKIPHVFRCFLPRAPIIRSKNGFRLVSGRSPISSGFCSETSSTEGASALIPWSKMVKKWSNKNTKKPLDPSGNLLANWNITIFWVTLWYFLIVCQLMNITIFVNSNCFNWVANDTPGMVKKKGTLEGPKTGKSNEQYQNYQNYEVTYTNTDFCWVLGGSKSR